jgi:YesN/AraC family two-component response regulator
MSVIEAIAPIYSNEISIGYMMFGQILPTDYSEVRCAALRVSELYGIPLTNDMLSEMPTADEEYIKSAVNMMTMCANYLYTNEIIRNDPNIFIYQLKEYISSHINSDMTIESLCKHFYISRTKLYKISSSKFGMGITDYIRLSRVKRAKKLLRSTDKTVSEISADVGIKDANYFIRTFKQSEGITPLQYRKSVKNS